MYQNQQLHQMGAVNSTRFSNGIALLRGISFCSTSVLKNVYDCAATIIQNACQQIIIQVSKYLAQKIEEQTVGYGELMLHHVGEYILEQPH